jgi:uncharacterized membrane protein
MKQRFYHKTEGQNVVLIAGILALLIGMAALAVDLGVTYAEQRNIVRGTNAASLAGMNRLISGGRDADVARAIYESLRSNGIPVTPPGEAPQPGDRSFEAIYLGSDGAPIPGACSRVGACGSQRPEGVKYIQISLAGEVETYFCAPLRSERVAGRRYRLRQCRRVRNRVLPVRRALDGRRAACVR